MKFALFGVLLCLVGCASPQPTFSPVKPVIVAKPPAPPPLPSAPVITPKAPTGLKVAQIVQPPSTNSPAKPAVSSIANLPTNNCIVIQWMIRPLSYSVDVTTNLTLPWHSLGVNITTNFVAAPGQVLISTNLFPSGQAVTFTNGNPAIVFVDYDIGSPMKFYRLREVQP